MPLIVSGALIESWSRFRTLQVWRTGSNGFAKRFPQACRCARPGAGTNENRRMLAAFRWNLAAAELYRARRRRVLDLQHDLRFRSAAPVRKSASFRALGASRGLVLAAFVAEAACFGLFGALIAMPLGRLMAGGAVQMMGATVEALYVSSRSRRDRTDPIFGFTCASCRRRRCRRFGVFTSSRSILCAAD